MSRPSVIAPSIAGFSLTLAGAILFSTKAVIVKKAFADLQVDALLLLAMRMLFALPFYVLAVIYMRKSEQVKAVSKRQWLVVALLGLSGYYASSFLDFVGLQYVSAALERLILFLYPTFTVLINLFMFGQKVSRTQQLALALTYTGIAIAFASELSGGNQGENLLWGCFLIFVCAITYSIYIVGSGRLIPVVGPTRFTAYAMLAATGGIFLHFLLAGGLQEFDPTPRLWLYGFLLGTVSTVAPSFLISFGMKKIGANNVAIISAIGPVSTILQAHYFLGEQILAAQIAGTVLVIAGVILIGWKRNSLNR